MTPGSAGSPGHVLGFFFEIPYGLAYSGSQPGQLAPSEKQYQYKQDDYDLADSQRAYHGLGNVRFFSVLFPEQVFDLIEQLEEFLGLPVAVE